MKNIYLISILSAICFFSILKSSSIEDSGMTSPQKRNVYKILRSFNIDPAAIDPQKLSILINISKTNTNELHKFCGNFVLENLQQQKKAAEEQRLKEAAAERMRQENKARQEKERLEAEHLEKQSQADIRRQKQQKKAAEAELIQLMNNRHCELTQDEVQQLNEECLQPACNYENRHTQHKINLGFTIFHQLIQQDLRIAQSRLVSAEPIENDDKISTDHMRPSSIEAILKERANTSKLSVITRPMLTQPFKRPPMRRINRVTQKVDSVADNEMHKEQLLLDDKGRILSSSHEPLLNLFLKGEGLLATDEADVGPSHENSPVPHHYHQYITVATALQNTLLEKGDLYGPLTKPSSPPRARDVRRNLSPVFESTYANHDSQGSIMITSVNNFTLMSSKSNWYNFFKYWDLAEANLILFIRSENLNSQSTYNLCFIPSDFMPLNYKNALSYGLIVPMFYYKKILKSLENDLVNDLD